jgi:hypothetical protein
MISPRPVAPTNDANAKSETTNREASGLLMAKAPRGKARGSGSAGGGRFSATPERNSVPPWVLRGDRRRKGSAVQNGRNPCSTDVDATEPMVILRV